MFMQQKLGLRRFFTMKTTPEETKKKMKIKTTIQCTN